jgi:hypothetical protein
MPIIASDIQYRLSGGAANSNPLTSLGGAKSSVSSGTTLFDDVPSSEATSGHIEYRCVYVHNNNGTDSYLDPVRIWISTNTPSPSTTIEIGLGTSALNATEQTVANETTAPVGVTFSAPSNFASGISLGTIPAGQHRAVWLRRTVTAGAAAFADSATLSVQGDINP